MSVVRLFHKAAGILRTEAKRNIGISAPALAKASDPIQQLFVDKLREYRSKSSGGKLVDASPELEKELKQEHQKLIKQYGGADGVDMTKFPDFSFTDPKLDSINIEE